MAITFDELFAFVKSERRLQYKCVVLFVNSIRRCTYATLTDVLIPC